MKTASKIMYIIGVIANILLLILSAIMIVISIIGLVNPEFAEQLKANIQNLNVPMANYLGASLGLSIYLFAASLIVVALTFRAIRNLNRGNGRVGTHILLLIGGILCWDIFYVLGGIFGIIGSSK